MPRFQNTALITESFSINKVFLKVLGESLCFVRRFSIQLKGNKRTLVSSCKLCKNKTGEQNKLGEFFLTVNHFTSVEAHAHSGWCLAGI